MKKIKKILALALAMAMVLGMTLTTFAEESEATSNPAETAHNGSGKSDDTGKITISNVEGTDTISVTAYQIIKAVYARGETATGENDGYFSGYANVYNRNDLPAFINVKGEYDESQMSDENLAKVYAAVLADRDAFSKDLDQVTNTTSYSAEVPIGTYLVVITGAEGKIYSNIVVSTRYLTDADEVGNGATVADTEYAIVDGSSWVKVQEQPNITKEIVTDEESTKSNSANVGEEISFKIEADIPYYGGENPVYKVTDNLVGLKYVSPSLKVEVKNSDGDVVAELKKADYLEDSAGAAIADNAITKDIILNFVKVENGKNVYKLADYAGDKLVITYKAKVDLTDAKYNEEANTNTATLDYTRNSNVAGEGDTTDDITKTYTFDLSGTINGNDKSSLLNKKGEATTTDTEIALGGAEFIIYQKDSENNNIPYTNEKMTETYTDDGFTTTKVTSSNNEDTKGQLSIRGLAAGTYYLKEVKAPDGYSLNNAIEYKIVVIANIEDGELTSWEIKFNDGEEKDLVVKNAGTETFSTRDEDAGNIYNTKLTQLPSTGGIGTTIFTIGGCAIMILAAALYFVSRRKAAK